jgi:hypothetical protein
LESGEDNLGGGGASGMVRIICDSAASFVTKEPSSQKAKEKGGPQRGRLSDAVREKPHLEACAFLYTPIEALMSAPTFSFAF